MVIWWIRIIEYHVERARGGVAMIVMSNFVGPASWRETGSWGGTLPLTPLGGLDMASDPALIPLPICARPARMASRSSPLRAIC